MGDADGRTAKLARSGTGSGALCPAAVPSSSHAGPVDDPGPDPTGLPGPPTVMLALLRLIAHLPLSLLHAVGAAAGAAGLVFSSSFGRRIRQHLGYAGLDSAVTPGAAARQAGRMVAELPFVWFRPLGRVLERVTTDRPQVLAQAEARARGIVFLTPHLGCFEVTARWYSVRHPITVLYQPPKQPALDAVQSAARDLPGLHAVPATLGGVRSMLRALRRGEAVGLLPDQVPGRGEGRWVDFFGRPAYTMTLPERLVEMTGAAVVMVAAERLPRGAGWCLHFEAMEGTPTPERVNAAMESLIRRFPAQYLWSYNRYKTP